MHVWVGPSRIAGKGLFAAQDIEKATSIVQSIGARIPKEESLRRLAEGNAYIFHFNERYDIDGKTLKNKARYINHSCDPDCEIMLTKSTIWIIAKRYIQEGEDLSYNGSFHETAKVVNSIRVSTAGITRCRQSEPSRESCPR